MKGDRLFIGDIYKCTQYVDHRRNGIEDLREEKWANYKKLALEGVEFTFAIYKENVILYKISENKYVELDLFDSIFDYMKLNVGKINNKVFKKLLIETFPTHAGSIYVDSKKIIPYKDSEKENEKPFAYQLKKKKIV